MSLRTALTVVVGGVLYLCAVGLAVALAAGDILEAGSGCSICSEHDDETIEDSLGAHEEHFPNSASTCGGCVVYG